MIKERRFLKLKEKKASIVFLSIIIQIEKNIYSFISTEANAFNKDFWKIIKTKLKKQTRFFNVDIFETHLNKKIKHQILKLKETIALKMIQYKNHLKTEFLFKKKLIKTIIINYLKIVIHNAIILKKKLKKQFVKKAEIKVFKNMNLKFLCFSDDHSRDIIIHFQHN